MANSLVANLHGTNIIIRSTSLLMFSYFLGTRWWFLYQCRNLWNCINCEPTTSIFLRSYLTMVLLIPLIPCGRREIGGSVQPDLTHATLLQGGFDEALWCCWWRWYSLFSFADDHFEIVLNNCLVWNKDYALESFIIWIRHELMDYISIVGFFTAIQHFIAISANVRVLSPAKNTEQRLKCHSAMTNDLLVNSSTL